jgi:hypothetical protein
MAIRYGNGSLCLQIIFNEDSAGEEFNFENVYSAVSCLLNIDGPIVCFAEYEILFNRSECFLET